MVILETDIEQILVKHCNQLGWQCIKLVMVSGRGFPDRTVFKGHGQLFFVEVKKPGGRISRKQQLLMDDLRKEGFNVYVVWSVDDINTILNEEVKLENQNRPAPVPARSY